MLYFHHQILQFDLLFTIHFKQRFKFPYLHYQNFANLGRFEHVCTDAGHLIQYIRLIIAKQMLRQANVNQNFSFSNDTFTRTMLIESL